MLDEAVRISVGLLIREADVGITVDWLIWEAIWIPVGSLIGEAVRISVGSLIEKDVGISVGWLIGEAVWITVLVEEAIRILVNILLE